MSRGQVRRRKPQRAHDRAEHATGSRGWLMPALVGIAALVIYVVTLAPTVTAEDSGELIAAAWHFGIPHPPGYPLWTLLCGIFLRVAAFGEIAWRANLFSAVCTALAAGVFAAALRQLGAGRAAAASAALVWALSRWTWMQAVITEVYGLNALATSILLYCAVRWRRTRSHRLLLVASLVFGLGMCNHHTIALAALALILWILVQAPRLLLRWRLVLASLGLFAAGLLPYAYLPLRARTDPPMNWGNPTTARAFWDHITRHQYGAVGPMKTVVPRSLPRIGRQIGYVAEAVRDDLTWPLAAIALGGLAVMARRERNGLLLVILWLATTGLLFVLLANFDQDRISRFAMRVFLIPVTMSLTVPLAFAFDAALGAAPVRKRTKQKPQASPSRAGTLRALIAMLIFVAPAWQALAHWRQCDYSDYYYARDHAENLLACMLPSAMFFPSGDHNTFPVAYLVLVEGVRSDVVIADLYGYTRPDLYTDRPADSPDSPEAWIIKQLKRPVYFATKTASPVDHAHFVQAGMLYHLLPDGMAFDADGLLEKCQYRNDALRRPTVNDLGAANINVDRHFFTGLDALTHGDLATALRNFEWAAGYGEGIKEVFNNIGSALAEYGHPDRAEPYFERAAAIDAHYALPRWNLYRVAAGRADWALARQRLEEVIAADPTDFRAYGQLGFLLDERLNDPRAARRAWEQSLSLNPNQPQIIARLQALPSMPP